MVIEKTFTLGRCIDPKSGPDVFGKILTLAVEELVHALICGSTGGGKSRTATSIALSAIRQNIPIAVIDKHGDTTDDIASHVALGAAGPDRSRTLARLRRFHYLEWSPFFSPRIDPFHFPVPKGIHPELVQNVLVSAREALADQVASHLQSTTQGTELFEGAPRLFRNLKNGLWGCVTPAPRLRLPSALVGVLLNVHHPSHRQVYARIEPFLPLAIRADFAALHGTKNAEKAREQVESALNRIGAFFSALLAESFGETSETAAVLDLESIIRKRHALVVNLRETPYFSHQQGITLGRYLASSIVDTLIRMPRDERPECFILLLEECGELLSEPFLRYLGAVRKFGCRMIFCAQDLGTLVHKEVNLVPKLLSQVGVVIAYNQRYPDDAETLARVLFQASVDFTPLVHEVEREGPLQWLPLEDRSRGGQRSTTTTHGSSASQGSTFTEQESKARANQRGWKRESSALKAVGSARSTGESHTENTVHGKGEAPIVKDFKLQDKVQLDNRQVGEAQAANEQTTDTETKTAGTSAGASGSDTLTETFGSGRGRSAEISETNSAGETVGDTWSITKKWVHIVRKVRELQETGQLKHGPSAEQLAQFQQYIMELPPRLAIVKKQGRTAVFMRSADMPDAFSSPHAQVKCLEWLKRLMLELHPYLFVPNLGPEREAERIEKFLRQNDGAKSLARTEMSTAIDEAARLEDSTDGDSSPLAI